MNASYKRPRFSFHCQKKENRVIYFLSGILDQDGGKEIRDDYSQHIGGCTNINFNLGETRIISSGGLAILVEIAKELKDKEIEFSLSQPSDMIMRTLKVVHIDRIIEIEM